MDFDLDGDRLREECGVFGIFGHPDARRSQRLVCTPCSIAVRRRRASSPFDGRRYNSERRLGLVGDHFSKSFNHTAASRRISDRSRALFDNGRNHSAQCAAAVRRIELRRFCRRSSTVISPMALSLRAELVQSGAINQSDLRYRSDPSISWRGAGARASSSASLRPCAPSKGHMRSSRSRTKKLIGARDPLGIRPLVLGELDGHYILASETCALDINWRAFRARYRKRRNRRHF